ncbi:MAG: restriction endonuclease subunit S [Synechococcus sp.]
MTNVREIELGELMPREGRGSVNPADYPGEVFELLSIPAYDRGSAEIALGSEIGSTKQAVQPGDVLLSKIVPHIRRAWVVEPSAGLRQIASSEWIVFRSKDVDARYLRHFLVSDGFHRQFMQTVSGVGGSLLRARPKYVAKIKIPLPPLEEQRRIAAILDKAQDISHKSQLSDALASTLIESEMIRRFGRPGENQAHSRLLSLIEAGVSVIDCPHSTPKWTEEGKVCLRTSNLGKGNWIWEDTRRISDDDFQERSRRASLEPGDIVLSREGTVGIAAIVTTNMDACMGQRLVQLKLDSRHLTPEYLLAQLLCLLKPERISHAMTGSTSKHINVKDLRELKISCPPIEEQFAFDDFCKQTKKVRARITLLKKDSEILSRSIQAASFCS